MALRRSTLALLLLGVSLAPAWPLELAAGGLRLVLHEQIGRFSLFSAGKPLFVDHDPRTSYVALLLDGRVHRLGDSGEFKLQTEQTSGGARFVFSGRRFAAEESFELRENGTLELAVTVTNRSDREVVAGVRFLLDTRLGEAQQSHFQTTQPVDSESEYRAADMPSFWQSGPATRADGPGLRGILRGEHATAPDRLVLANWKRLNEATWLYEVGAGRSFSDLPYSINDSAVCQYYDPFPLAPGARRTIVIVLKAAGELPVEAAVQPAMLPAAAPPQNVPPAGELRELEAQAAESGREELGLSGDLRVLNGLLQQLEQKLQSRAALSAEELRLMEQILADLKKRLEKTTR